MCRIKLPGGELRAEQALALAEEADIHASGIVELTNRANLQLRGVRAGEETALTERLLRAGLGPGMSDGSEAASDISNNSREPALPTALPTAAADDVRNVMISPAAGRDPQALCDTRPLARQLLALLQSEPRFATLSPKFALLLDGGEALAMIDHPHDIWLYAIRVEQGEPWFAFGLAGRPATDSAGALGAVPASGVPSLVGALVHTFIDFAGPEDSRMRHVIARHGADAIVRHASLSLRCSLRRPLELAPWQRLPAEPARRFGAHRQRQPGLWHVGAQPPLGRMDTAALRELAALARRHGAGTLNVTPWQSVLLPDIAEQSVAHVETALDGLGFVRDAAHPLARLIACAGSAGCAKSHADTKADALALASRLPAGAHVHLSGCVRSCAAAHPVVHTLLAVEPGRYDLYHRGPPQSEATEPATLPTTTPTTAATAANAAEAARRFGRRIGSHLTIDEAAEALGAPPRSPTHA